MIKKNLILRTHLNDDLLTQLNIAFNVYDFRGEKNWFDESIKLGSKVDALLTNGHDGASKELIEGLPSLKIIACNGVGYDAVDIDTAVNNNIVVTHTPGVLDKDVANTTILMLLASSRHFIRDINWVKEGKWVSKGIAPLTHSIEGKKVGLVGLGRIGQCIANKLSVFSCEISYHCRNEKKELAYRFYEDLLDLAKDMDYLIVITPGDASTYHLINEKILHALGKNGTLINVSRGSVVDEKALITALKTGSLGAAALDVFENEPHVPDELLKMENVIALPHVGSATHETRYAMGSLAIENITLFFEKGQAKTPVPECIHI